MSIDRLLPVPGRSDYLTANGPRALVSEQSQTGWPFELALCLGRSRLGVKLRASEEGSSSLEIAALGDEIALEPGDLSLFVRACIRRAENDRCVISWPASLQLDADDPLAARTQSDGNWIKLEASYSDLRPVAQSAISEVYRYPLDVPWLYDPLDYEVMIPILNARGIRRILDLGCGSGRNAVPLENAGYEVYGVDSASESLGICRCFVRAPERFLLSLAASVPFRDGFFDAVLDVGCLHMIASPETHRAVLLEMARVLRPGGIMCGRALSPRNPQWLAAQPFRTEATGFSVEDLSAEAPQSMKLQILAKTEHLLYYQYLKLYNFTQDNA